MTKEEFQTEFRRLLAAYPYFQPAAAEEIARLWWEKLSDFSRETMHSAVDQVVILGDQFMPPLGVFLKRCRDIHGQARVSRMRDCKLCNGTGWRYVEVAGMTKVAGCECNPQPREKINEAGDAR